MIYSHTAHQLAEKLYNTHNIAREEKDRMPWSHLTLTERTPWLERASAELSSAPQEPKPEPPTFYVTPMLPAVEALTPETVDHPRHYGGKDDPYEAVKVIEAWQARAWPGTLGFHLGNAVKYIARAGVKPGVALLEDLRKARWYIDRAIEYTEARNRGDKP